MYKSLDLKYTSIYYLIGGRSIQIIRDSDEKDSDNDSGGFLAV